MIQRSVIKINTAEILVSWTHNKNSQLRLHTIDSSKQKDNQEKFTICFLSYLSTRESRPPPLFFHTHTHKNMHDKEELTRVSQSESKWSGVKILCKFSDVFYYYEGSLPFKIYRMCRTYYDLQWSRHNGFIVSSTCIKDYW